MVNVIIIIVVTVNDNNDDSRNANNDYNNNHKNKIAIAFTLFQASNKNTETHYVLLNIIQSSHSNIFESIDTKLKADTVCLGTVNFIKQH